MSPTERPAVEAANQQLYTAFETGDLDLMTELWDTDDEVVCVHPGWPMLRGRASVLRSWALLMANTSYIQFFLTDVDVEIDGDLAVVTCTENILTSVEAAGGHSRAVATNVFRRRDGGWRLRVHHGSPVLGTLVDDDDEDEAGEAGAGDEGGGEHA